MRILPILVLTLVATPAVAQNSTTQCVRVGSAIQCSTNAVPAHSGPDNFLDAIGPLGDPAAAFAQGAKEAQEAELRQQQIQMNVAALAARPSPPLQAPTISMAERDRRVAESLKENSHKLVGDMLSKGQCVEAVSFALSMGDIELANQATVFCSNSSKNP